MAESAPWEAESEQHTHGGTPTPLGAPRLDQFKVRVRKETPAQHSARKGPLVS